MKFKNEKDEKLFFSLHPILILILADVNLYTVQNFKKEITITDTISTAEQDKKLGRKSTAHQRRVAADIRTNNFTIEEINQIKSYLENKKEYENYKYISFNGQKRLAYFHDNGNGAHFHIQIHSKYSLTSL